MFLGMHDMDIGHCDGHLDLQWRYGLCNNLILNRTAFDITGSSYTYDDDMDPAGT